MCGTVTWASEKARKAARRGSTSWSATKLLTDCKSTRQRRLAVERCSCPTTHPGERENPAALSGTAQGLGLHLGSLCQSQIWSGTDKAVPAQTSRFCSSPGKLSERFCRKSRLKGLHETDSLEHCSGCGDAWSIGVSVGSGPRGQVDEPEAKRDRQCRALRRRLLRNRLLGALPRTRRRGGERPEADRYAHPYRPPLRRRGLYKGRAFEPKRNIRGSATVRQVGPGRHGREGLRGARNSLLGAALEARQLSDHAARESARQDSRLKRRQLVRPIAVGREARSDLADLRMNRLKLRRWS